MEGDLVSPHLLKLPPSISEETLAEVLETLWSTRRTGLAPHQKPRVQSLLGLSAPQDLDPVLACLRSIIRKCVNEKFAGDDIQKLFPVDLCSELQSILVLLLQRYQDQWKDEASRDQPLWQRSRVSYHVSRSPALRPVLPSELSSSLWPREGDATDYPDGNNISGHVPSYADSNLPQMAPTTQCRENGSLNDMVIPPRLKSMTWTMENRSSAPANRVAVITLKLQDYTKSLSGEVEVKFRLSKDTLEAMLRSMAYISEQFSNSVMQPSEPLSKKQKQ